MCVLVDLVQNIAFEALYRGHKEIRAFQITGNSIVFSQLIQANSKKHQGYAKVKNFKLTLLMPGLQYLR